MNALKTGWFSEINDLWPGVSQSLQVESIIFAGESEYQSILILQTKSHGKALILDGIIQCTEFDEFSYQEMISFVPLCTHSNPETILIVGGGDGGVAREVVKFPSVKKVIQIEIDKKVIEASKKFLHFMSKELTNPKIEVIIGDGFEFMKKHNSEFDVIITDSSDPVGPAICLFQEAYFSLMKNALKKNGLICSQAGTIWTNLNMIKKTVTHCKKFFSKVNYGIASVPTYPTGQIGFVLGSLDSIQVWFQQDGAAPHNPLVIRQYLEQEFSARWIGLHSPHIIWPPRSPDLTPLGYFYWGYLKNKLYDGTVYGTLPILRDRIIEISNNIPEEIKRKAIEQFQERLDWCNLVQGGHFEHLLKRTIGINDIEPYILDQIRPDNYINYGRHPLNQIIIQ